MQILTVQLMSSLSKKSSLEGVIVSSWRLLLSLIQGNKTGRKPDTCPLSTVLSCLVIIYLEGYIMTGVEARKWKQWTLMKILSPRRSWEHKL